MLVASRRVEPRGDGRERRRANLSTIDPPTIGTTFGLPRSGGSPLAAPVQRLSGPAMFVDSGVADFYDTAPINGVVRTLGG